MSWRVFFNLALGLMLSFRPIAAGATVIHRRAYAAGIHEVFGNDNGTMDTFSSLTAGNFSSTIGSAGTRAFGFSTSTSVYTVDHFAISFKVNSTSTPVARVRLFTGTSTAPTTDTGFSFTMAPAISGTAAAVYTATPTTTLQLAASSNYWLLLDNTGSQFITWTMSSASGTAPNNDGTSGYASLAGYSNTADDLSGTPTTGITTYPNIAIYGY